MAGPPPLNDPNVRAALQKLADIETPPPPDWLPRTWGWAGVAVVLLALAAWALLAWRRRREANRYRVEALGELQRIEGRFGEGDTAAALAALAVLLKRVALAAWPRGRVASLSGRSWTDFLSAGGVAGPLAAWLCDGEYRPLPAVSLEEARACVSEARRWIETHRVPA
jgi:hypothetical protein